MAEPTIEDLLAEATPREVVTRVVLRQDLLARHAELEAELQAVATEDLRHNRDPLAVGVAEQIAELEAEIEAAQRPFTFRAIGHRKWSDLIRLYPPTKAQRAMDPQLDHNPDQFPAAAIAASCVSPTLDMEQALRLEDHVGLAQWLRLWNACLNANVGGGDVPKSMAAGGILRARGAFARTAVVEESLAQSSSDGPLTT